MLAKWGGLSPEKRAEQEHKRRERLRRFYECNPDYKKAKAIARDKVLQQQRDDWAAYKNARLDEL